MVKELGKMPPQLREKGDRNIVNTLAVGAGSGRRNQ